VAGRRSEERYKQLGVHRRGDGWSKVVWLNPRKGKPFRRRITRADPEDVLRAEAEFKTKAWRGEIVNSGGMTAGELVDRWMYKAGLRTNRKLADRTIEGYNGVVRRYVLAWFADLPLDRVTVDHVDQLYRELLTNGRKGGGALSTKTVREVHTILNQVFKLGCRDGLLARNPAEYADVPSVGYPPEFTVMEPELVARVLEAVRGTNMETAAYLGLFAGLRLSEALGLRWADVDLEAGIIDVRWAAQSVPFEGVKFKPPKTPRSRREVPIGAVLVAKLRAHRVAQSERRLAAGPKWQDHDLVLTSPLYPGLPWSTSGASASFAKVVRDHGLPRVRFHDLRHGYATLLGAVGTALEDVSRMLGHSTQHFTADRYRKPIAATKREAVARLDALFTS
jgi:integrase